MKPKQNQPTVVPFTSTRGAQPSSLLKTGLAIAACAFLVSGCVSGPSTSPLGANTSPIVLQKAQTLPVTYGNATVPSGEYMPVYQTKEGVFYAAPTSLFFALNTSGQVLWSYLVDTPVEGGVCIVTNKEGLEIHGVWVDPSYEKHEDLPTRMSKGDHPARKGCYMRLLEPFEYHKTVAKE